MNMSMYTTTNNIRSMENRISSDKCNMFSKYFEYICHLYCKCICTTYNYYYERYKLGITGGL